MSEVRGRRNFFGMILQIIGVCVAVVSGMGCAGPGFSVHRMQDVVGSMPVGTSRPVLYAALDDEVVVSTALREMIRHSRDSRPVAYDDFHEENPALYDLMFLDDVQHQPLDVMNKNPSFIDVPGFITDAAYGNGFFFILYDEQTNFIGYVSSSRRR